MDHSAETEDFGVGHEPMPGLTPTSLTQPQIAALLQGWQGFPTTLTIHHVLIMLSDLGVIGGVTNTQISQTVQSAGGPSIRSRGGPGS